MQIRNYDYSSIRWVATENKTAYFWHCVRLNRDSLIERPNYWKFAGVFKVTYSLKMVKSSFGLSLRLPYLSLITGILSNHVWSRSFTVWDLNPAVVLQWCWLCLNGICVWCFCLHSQKWMKAFEPVMSRIPMIFTRNLLQAGRRNLKVATSVKIEQPQKILCG